MSNEDLVKLAIQKLVAMKGLAYQPQAEAFCLGTTPFLYISSPGTLRFLINEAARARMADALTAERRARVDHPEQNWVTMSFESEIDVELVLVYVRNAFKLMKAELG